MSEVDELKPCPFCGSKDIDERGWLSGDGGAGPQCMNCGATAEPQWWNTRAESPDSVEEGKWSAIWIDAQDKQPSIKFWAESHTDVERICDALNNSADTLSPPPPPVAGGDVDYCAMFTSLCEGLEIDPAIVGVSTLAGIKAVGKAIASQAKSAALQHQDCVVISRECAERCLVAVEGVAVKANEFEFSDVVQELKQSLEPKNGQ